ncbi:MAG: hypothetical protein HRT47_04010 [Candidatus Caenarcaniphilales bacterium]|nr:hypothetical protein [Candidatus Caenarcaniphilales bacterium]
MKIFNDELKITLFLIFTLVIFTHLPTRAALIPAQCSSGNCNLNLRINDRDINKFFPDAFPGFRVRLDLNPLKLNNFESDHFRVIVNEQTSSGANIVSSHTVRFPNKRSRRRNYQLILDIPEFLGSKIFFMDFYRNDGALQASYSVPINGFGSTQDRLQNSQGIIYGQNLASIVPTQLGVSVPNSVLDTRVCPDDNFNDCNLDELFFHNFAVEASTIQDPHKTSLLKEEDGTIRLRVPVVASRRRRNKRISSVRRETLVTADDPAIGQDPSLTNNQPVNISQVDELNIGSGSNFVNFSIDDVNQELEIDVNNFPNPIVIRSDSIGFDPNTPQATVDLERGSKTNKPSILINNSPLSNPPRSGAFEFNNGNLYFSANGVREFILLDPTNQFAGSGSTVNVKANLAGNADSLGTNNSNFYLNASNLNSGTISINHLPNIDQIDRLFNDSTSHSMVLVGADDIVLTSQADVNLTLPTAGTLATTDNLPVVIPPNSVNSANITDNNLLNEDFANNSISSAKLANLNASVITSGTVDPLRLPNRDISDITNLTTELNDKLEVVDIEDNLLSTSTTTALSANQGRVLKNLIDALIGGFGTVNSNLPGTDIDFNEFHSVYSKTLDQDETFTISNLQQGHKVFLILEGEFNPTFPSFFNLLEGAYNQEALNVIQLDVINDQASIELVHMKIFNLPRIELLLSVRKVNQAYNGPCVTVRRSSDDAEQNIYFLPNNNLDTTSLLNFVGAGNDGFVTKWFDQSFNGFHVEQSSASLQPKIVDAGALVLSDNPFAAIDFTDDFLRNADLQIAQSFSLMTVAATTVASQDEPANYILNQGDNSTFLGRGLFLEADNDFAALNGGTSLTKQSSGLTVNESYLLHYNYNENNLNSNSKIFINGIEGNNSYAPAGNPADNSPLHIGRRSDQNNSYAEMKVQEIRIYNRSLSDSFRQSLETEINNYFNIY